MWTELFHHGLSSTQRYCVCGYSQVEELGSCRNVVGGGAEPEVDEPIGNSEIATRVSSMGDLGRNGLNTKHLQAQVFTSGRTIDMSCS